MDEIKYAAIVPLIGGMILGAKRTANANKTGTLGNPSYILSYPTFKSNDEILTRYLPDIPYHVIDPVTNSLDVQLEQVDFVSALCPCAERT